MTAAQIHAPTRDQIRARIDALECLDDVQAAIDDLGCVEWEEREPQTFDLSVMTNSDRQGVTFVHNLPPSVLLKGLQEMQRELAKLAGLREPA